ncbi:MAG: transglycosylase domain-containing protein [Clostridium sp.]|nr:transglycosylase domain-containing protein [Clostridium sp.]
MQYRFDAAAPAGKNTANSARKPAHTKKPRKPRKRHPALRALLYVFSVCAMATFFICAYVLLHAIQFVGGEKAISLEDYKLEQAKTTIIYAYTDSSMKKTVEIARLHGEENRVWVPLTSMPDDLKNAVVALEDKRFWSHNGVDWFRTASSIIIHHGTQGGSTLTQQTIKNLTNEKDVTVVRKVKEILNALNLERYYEKNDILETYLNTAYFGEGCYGVQTASEVYFGKDVNELSLAECAAIVTITNEPTTYDPLVNPDNTKKRQLVCLGEMLAQELITQEQYDEAKDEKLVYTNSKDYKAKEATAKSVGSDEVTSSFVDYVIEDVIAGLMAERSYTREQATNHLYYRGLKIYTTMNVEAQKAAEAVFLEKTGVPAADAKQGVQASMTMMDYEGHIVAMVGQLGKKTASRSLNRATTIRRPGSTFKPLSTYSAAIENNLLYWSKLYLDKAINLGTQSSPDWFPHNYNGTLGSGNYYTVQYALKESLNTIPARIVYSELGTEGSYKWLTENLHFSTIDEESRYSLAALSIGSGSINVNTVEMCAAYAAIGNLGKYYKPTSYYKVIETQNEEEKEIITLDTVAEQVMKPETAELTRRILQTINRSPYKLNSTLKNFQSFMKTGTTDGYKDRWFALGFPDYIAVMWYGFDTPATTTHSMNYNPAGMLGFQTFNKIASSMKTKNFENSGGLVQRTYCTKTGLLANKNCPSTASGWYVKTNLPGTCTDH